MWKAGGVPDLQVFPPLVHYPGGRVRPLTKREAHARFMDEQGDEAYVEFNKQFVKRLDREKPKKRKASSDDQSRKPKVPRRAQA